MPFRSSYNSLVNPDIVHRLLTLNRQFYQTFGQSFSSTRQRLQPGVKRIFSSLLGSTRLLDLGCGNGQLWRALARSGYSGVYVGLDFSPQLLIEAGEQGGGKGRGVFLQADLSDEAWQAAVPELPFDVAVAFAVLHHLPGQTLRLEVLRKMHRLLAPGGRFFHSEWQFLNSARLRGHIQPWEAAGLSPGQVDPGDYLLDWRHGGYGLRYAHHFDQAELAELAEESGFHVVGTFLLDGENGKSGLYQEWEKNIAPI